MREYDFSGHDVAWPKCQYSYKRHGTAARPATCTWKTVGMATLSTLILLSKQC